MKNMKRFIILLSSLLIVSSLSSVVAFAEENESTGAYIPEGIEIADPIVSDENKIQKDNKENDLNVISDVSDLITDHETIITMLNDFVKGNQLSDVRIGDDKTSGKVILSYYYVYPGQGDMFKNFISEKNIDANEIMILVMEGAIEAPDKEEENSLITDHETIIAMLNDFVKENQMSDVRIGDDEASGKIILSYYYVYPKQKEMFENFFSEKNIDSNEITMLVMEGAIEVSDKTNENSLITDHETIIAMLNDFVKENQMSGVKIGDDKASGKIILSYYYVYPEQKEMFENFISEKNINADEITILVMESAAEVSDNLKGDTNCDNQVDLSDAVMIMQALANPNKYGLDGTAENHMTEQGKLNGDMDGDGLTVGDAQAIQRKLLGLEVTNSQENDNQQPVSVKYESFSHDYPYYNTVSDLANKANQVFSGKVTNISFEMLDLRTMQPVKADEDSQRAMICTIYEIEAEEVYAGTPTIVKLRIEGGIPSSFEQEQITLLGSDTIPVMEGAPVLEVGSNYLFALYHEDGSEYSSILNPMQSIYTEDNVNTDGVSGADIISYFS